MERHAVRHSIMVLVILLLSSLSTPATPAPMAAQDPQPLTPVPQGPPCPPGDPCGGEGPGSPRFFDGQWLVPEGASPPVQTPGIAPFAIGGPDDFGYTWNDSVAFNWIDATGGTDSGLSGDDQYTGPIDIGFSFKFYGNTYSQLYISTNGFVSFGQGYGIWYNQPIPDTSPPNDFIAPFWDDLAVGGDYNSGRVYYRQYGSAPNRYFVVEWWNVTRLGSSDLLTFEVILYENGDIVMQYLSLSGVLQSATVGIEDDWGTDGLLYLYNAPGLSNNKAIRFYRPAPAARVGAWPLYQDSFTHCGAVESFSVTIRNTGELGTDTFDLTTGSAWTVALYRADGTTPLTDTDGDGKTDTGSLAQGQSIAITVKVTTPGTASVGDHNSATITVRSSRDTSKSKTIVLQTAVPAPFAQVYQDAADGAMSLYLARPTRNALVRKVTPDWYYGYDMAVAETSGSNFLYAWAQWRCLDPNCNLDGSEIEYTLASSCGPPLRGVSRLTDHSGAIMYTYDEYPAVAVAPNGRMGVIWRRYLWNQNTAQFNFNIWFAVLDTNGAVVYGPVNVTNNNAWGTESDLNVPRFWRPRIAATTDNRFVLAWQREHRESAGWVNDIYYAVRSSSGSTIAGPTRLTNDTPGDSGYYAPNLAQLWSSRAILTWVSRSSGNDDIYYAVVNSNGTVVKPATDLSVDETVVDWWNYDVVQLSNGWILVAWEAWGCFPDEWTSRIRFAILDSSYNRVVAPTCLERHPAATSGDTAASVTADASGHAVLTWMDRDPSLQHNLYYALVDSNGSVLTPPMVFRTAGFSPWGDRHIFTSFQGYGNTSFSQPDILACRTHLPLTLRDYLTYFEGPWEVEPNNTYLQANGPLRSGRDYYGYPNDEKDYFSIYVRRSGTITIDLSNHTGQGVQLQLFYQSTANRVAYDLDPPYHITYNGQPGWYYIYIYTAGGYHQATPYTLRVTFPE